MTSLSYRPATMDRRGNSIGFAKCWRVSSKSPTIETASGGKQMISHSSSDPAPAPRRPEAASIEYFAIQLCPAADGRFFVGIEATICECEGELSQMELGHHRVASLDD